MYGDTHRAACIVEESMAERIRQGYKLQMIPISHFL